MSGVIEMRPADGTRLEVRSRDASFVATPPPPLHHGGPMKPLYPRRGVFSRLDGPTHLRDGP
jgi:hypothetical protein